MKSLNLKSLFTITACAVLLLSSCTMEKRVYNKGYHTESAKKVQKKQHVTSTPSVQMKEEYASTHDDVTPSPLSTNVKQDEVQLKNGKIITGKVVTTNAKTTSVVTNNTTKNLKNNQIVSIKQANDEVLVPQNNAKIKAKGNSKAVDKETFLPNLLALIFGGVAFLIFLWIAVVYWVFPIVSLIFAIITIALGVVAIIFGIKGIKAGGSFKWMGIVGLALGAAAALIAFIMLIIAIINIAK